MTPSIARYEECIKGIMLMPNGVTSTTNKESIVPKPPPSASLTSINITEKMFSLEQLLKKMHNDFSGIFSFGHYLT